MSYGRDKIAEIRMSIAAQSFPDPAKTGSPAAAAAYLGAMSRDARILEGREVDARIRRLVGDPPKETREEFDGRVAVFERFCRAAILDPVKLAETVAAFRVREGGNVEADQ